MQESLDLARRIADIAAEEQASDIVLLDMRAACSFTDYFVICSCESNRQIDALRDSISKALKEENGLTPLHLEGDAASGWVLIDYVSVIVHIFSTEERDYFQLEQLWCQAPIVVRIL